VAWVKQKKRTISADTLDDAPDMKQFISATYAAGATMAEAEAKLKNNQLTVNSNPLQEVGVPPAVSSTLYEFAPLREWIPSDDPPKRLPDTESLRSMITHIDTMVRQIDQSVAHERQLLASDRQEIERLNKERNRLGVRAGLTPHDAPRAPELEDRSLAEQVARERLSQARSQVSAHKASLCPHNVTYDRCTVADDEWWRALYRSKLLRLQEEVVRAQQEVYAARRQVRVKVEAGDRQKLRDELDETRKKFQERLKAYLEREQVLKRFEAHVRATQQCVATIRAGQG